MKGLILVKELREEIYTIKEDIYSANIEKRKLNEKLYILNENIKKVNEAYEEYKKLSDKVDNIKSVKDVKEFKNINLKSRISTKRNNIAKKEINYKSEDVVPSAEYLASMELKESYNKLHYNDKTTLEDKKVYLASECKELINKSTSNTNITLFASLSDSNKYEIESGSCEEMIRAYATLEELRSNTKKENNLLVIELKKNSHYIPAMTSQGGFCGLIGGEVTIVYKEKINTGSGNVDIWHVKK